MKSEILILFFGYIFIFLKCSPSYDYDNDGVLTIFKNMYNKIKSNSSNENSTSVISRTKRDREKIKKDIESNESKVLEANKKLYGSIKSLICESKSKIESLEKNEYDGQEGHTFMYIFILKIKQVELEESSKYSYKGAFLENSNVESLIDEFYNHSKHIINNIKAGYDDEFKNSTIMINGNEDRKLREFEISIRIFGSSNIRFNMVDYVEDNYIKLKEQLNVKIFKRSIKIKNSLRNKLKKLFFGNENKKDKKSTDGNISSVLKNSKAKSVQKENFPEMKYEYSISATNFEELSRKMADKISNNFNRQKTTDSSRMIGEENIQKILILEKKYRKENDETDETESMVGNGIESCHKEKNPCEENKDYRDQRKNSRKRRKTKRLKGSIENESESSTDDLSKLKKIYYNTELDDMISDDTETKNTKKTVAENKPIHTIGKRRNKVDRLSSRITSDMDLNTSDRHFADDYKFLTIPRLKNSKNYLDRQDSRNNNPDSGVSLSSSLNDEMPSLDNSIESPLIQANVQIYENYPDFCSIDNKTEHIIFLGKEKITDDAIHVLTSSDKKIRIDGELYEYYGLMTNRLSPSKKEPLTVKNDEYVPLTPYIDSNGVESGNTIYTNFDRSNLGNEKNRITGKNLCMKRQEKITHHKCPSANFDDDFESDRSGSENIEWDRTTFNHKKMIRPGWQGKIKISPLFKLEDNVRESDNKIPIKEQLKAPISYFLNFIPNDLTTKETTKNQLKMKEKLFKRLNERNEKRKEKIKVKREDKENKKTRELKHRTKNSKSGVKIKKPVVIKPCYQLYGIDGRKKKVGKDSEDTNKFEKTPDVIEVFKKGEDKLNKKSGHLLKENLGKKDKNIHNTITTHKNKISNELTPQQRRDRQINYIGIQSNLFNINKRRRNLFKKISENKTEIKIEDKILYEIELEKTRKRNIKKRNKEYMRNLGGKDVTFLKKNIDNITKTSLSYCGGKRACCSSVLFEPAVKNYQRPTFSSLKFSELTSKKEYESGKKPMWKYSFHN